MKKEFKNMNELTEYLDNLEKRVFELEQENYKQRNKTPHTNLEST
jgi:hypothetical protein